VHFVNDAAAAVLGEWAAGDMRVAAAAAAEKTFLPYLAIN
jgi:hypothetical protein